MPVEVIMPQMGESIQEGTLVKWLKKPGDTVARDEPLFEISTDKVDAEIPSPAAGILSDVKVKEGETVAIKTVVALIETDASKGASAPAPAEAAKGSAAPSTASERPTSQDSPAARPAAPPPPPSARPATQGSPSSGPTSEAREVVPAERASSAGSRPTDARTVAGGQSSSPSASLDVPPPRRGGPPETSSGFGEGPAQGDPSASPVAASRSGTATLLEERLRTKSSPVVRKIAAEHGVEISGLTGSGISGRVTKKDILGYLETQPQAVAAMPTSTGAAARSTAGSAAAATATAGAPAEAPSIAEAPRTGGTYAPGERLERVPMTAMRKKIAEHMIASRHTSAHVTTVFEIDMTRVARIREAKKPAFQERHGVSLTYMPFIMKATIDALMAFPSLNASIDGTDILYKKDVNLGVAVALDWGLLVPVVKNAQDLSLSGLAKAVYDLATRARNKQLKPEEVQGGTFTITNPGVFGSLFGTPIISQPQVAILGVGTIEKRPVVIDDAIAIRTMAFFAISFDHRLIDGAVADQFMARIKKTLQEFDDATV